MTPDREHHEPARPAGTVAVRRFGDGLGVGPDLVGAAEVAVEQALGPLGGDVPDLVCVFVSGGDPESAAAAGRRVAERTGARMLVGTTAGGVLGDGRGIERGPAVAVWAAVLPGARLRPFRLTTERVAGELRVAGFPDIRDDDRAAVLLADPYSVPVGGFLEHRNAMAPSIPLVGGLAGTGGAGSNRLFLDGDVFTDGGVGVVLGGDVDVAAVVSQGCRPVGPPMVVTRSERNLLVELAGTPAYTRLGEIVSALPPAERELVAAGLHLGVVMDEYADEHGRGDFLIRAVLGVDTARGAVAVGDVVEVGQTVRFQVRDAASASVDLNEMLAARAATAPVAGALLFSCNGRGSGLFASADHDVAAVRAGFGADPVAGFFAAGEIGPVGGRNYLHGFTASLLAFHDSPPADAADLPADAPAEPASGS